MDAKYAALKPEDMKIIMEAEQKLCQATGQCVALVAYNAEG